MYFSRSRIAAMVAVCLFGILFAIPNIIPADNVIIHSSSGEPVVRWPSWLPNRRLNLGLDLKGGAYLLLKLDLNAMRKEQLETAQDAVKTQLRNDKIGFTTLQATPGGIHIVLRDPSQMNDALASLNRAVGSGNGGISVPAVSLSSRIGSTSSVNVGGSETDYTVLPSQDGTSIDVKMTEAMLKQRAAAAVEQSIEIIRRRIDQLGVAEPQIARQGEDRILVQLPGVQDPDRVKTIIGSTAKMNFRMLDETADPNLGVAPAGDEILDGEDKGLNGKPVKYVIRKKIEVSGGDLTDARAVTDPNSGRWMVSQEFNSVGAKHFADTTTANVGKRFAIVLDNKVISAPVIQEPITGGHGQISGNFDVKSANDLAVLLRAGALPAPLKIIEERSVGPDLGADSIKAGVLAACIGLGLVAVYMVLCYGLFGLFADIAVVFNLIITIALLSLIQATLTLPGIAGLLLSVGMSVDANILVNERIREESKLGRAPFAALEAGYKRAFSTVLDANLTTLIKMSILFMFGAGVVKGFAVTISFGIIISLFTAMILVRWMMITWLRRTKPKTLLAHV